MRTLVAVHNAYADPTSGAARSVRTMARWMAEEGHAVRVLATSRFDARPPEPIEDHLDGLGVDLRRGEGHPCRVARYALEGVPVTTGDDRPGARDRAESRQFLALLDRALAGFAPDRLLTCGSHPVVLESLRRARALGVATHFYVGNFYAEASATARRVATARSGEPAMKRRHLDHFASRTACPQTHAPSPSQESAA